MRKRKLRVRKQFIVFVIVVILLIIGIRFGIKKYEEYKYHQTYEYKLLQKEYNIDEVNVILNKLNEERVNEILNRDYIPSLTNFLNEKYFIYKNLDRYLEYYKKNPKDSYKDIVAIVNVNRDRNYYEEPIPTDTSLDTLMLVNKYYHLDEDYEPDNLEEVSSSYAYEGNILRSDVYEIFKNIKRGKKENPPFIIMKTDKGLTGPEELNGIKIRGNYKAHQIPLLNAKTDEKELKLLESWLKSYRFNELFDKEKGFLL